MGTSEKPASGKKRAKKTGNKGTKKKSEGVSTDAPTEGNPSAFQVAQLAATLAPKTEIVIDENGERKPAEAFGEQTRLREALDNAQYLLLISRRIARTSHAYELFDDEEFLTARQIGTRFRVCGWRKITSHPSCDELMDSILRQLRELHHQAQPTEFSQFLRQFDEGTPLESVLGALNNQKLTTGPLTYEVRRIVIEAMQALRYDLIGFAKRDPKLDPWELFSWLCSQIQCGVFGDEVRTIVDGCDQKVRACVRHGFPSDDPRIKSDVTPLPPPVRTDRMKLDFWVNPAELERETSTGRATKTKTYRAGRILFLAFLYRRDHFRDRIEKVE